MAGFQKPKPLQKSLKLAMFSRAGCGKTFTALLFAEGLAKHCGKRVAYVDTEHGTDFYVIPVDERRPHPEAFDIDAIYTKSIAEVAAECKALNPEEHGIIVIDSYTHLWQNAIDSHKGKKNRNGSIPMHAWGPIKKPYKALEDWLMNSPYHVIWCGREGTRFGKDDEGQDTALGPKMKAEGESPHEPNVLLQLSTELRGGHIIYRAWAEKDRTGILSSRGMIEFPCFENVVEPILKHLTGETQAQLPNDDDARIATAEAVADEDAAKAEESAKLFQRFRASYDLAQNADDLAAIGKEITTDVKRRMTNEDLTSLRELHRATCQSLGITQKPRGS